MAGWRRRGLVLLPGGDPAERELRKEADVDQPRIVALDEDDGAVEAFEFVAEEGVEACRPLRPLGLHDLKVDTNRSTEGAIGSDAPSGSCAPAGCLTRSPGPWFDYNRPGERRLVLLQGDSRQAGDPSDGAVARSQIAEVLVRSLRSYSALHKTFELVATTGLDPDDVGALFARLAADRRGRLTA